jgi:integrase/recombinase XerD
MLMSEPRPRFDALFRAFRFSTDAGAYWSVVDDGTYETDAVADRFLQYVRFGRSRAESTTRKYAEAIALYLSWTNDRGPGHAQWPCRPR